MITNNEKYNVSNLLNEIESTAIDIEEENEIDIVDNDEKRKLYVDKVDKSTSDLFRMIVEGEINLQPDYQRKFVWDIKTMSKFIESLLLSIPIPTIFLAENDDDSFEVIDGQQRLTTIFAFMKSKLNNEEIRKLSNYLKNFEELELCGLEALSQFNNKKYSDLEETKRKFNNVSLPIVIIKKDSTEDIKYDIFARINSGSIKLNNQELLNAMYRGKLLKELDDVASKNYIDDAFGKRPVLKKRYGYHEILLRAKVIDCYIDKKTWNLKEVKVKNVDKLNKVTKKYNGRLNSSIIEYLKEFRNDEEEAKNIRAFIEDSIDKVHTVFGDSAFIRVSKKGSTSINKTIAELQLVVLSRFDKEIINNKKDVIKESFDKFLEKSDQSIFTRGTNNTSNVEKRYEWGKMLSEELLED